MTDFDQSYLRGIDDALAEVRRRLIVASKLGERPSEYGIRRILDETANRLHSGDTALRGEVVHLIRHGSAVTTCCGRSPFELPRTDRLTVTEEPTCGELSR